MFPPWRSGGIVDRGPSIGARPISPQNGTIGTRTPGRNSARPPAAGTRVIRRAGSGKSSASSPKPGIEAVQPQSAGSNSRSSTWSVSPGSAPTTAIGPLTWSTRLKSSRARSSTVEVSVSCPPDASRRSNSTTAPLSTVSIGSIAGSHARWKRSRAILTAGLVAMWPPPRGNCRPTVLRGSRLRCVPSLDSPRQACRMLATRTLGALAGRKRPDSGAD